MTKQELLQRIQALEAELLSAQAGGGSSVYADVSKSVKDGKSETSQIIIRGVRVPPRTLNLYPTQLVRVLQNLPRILETSLALWDKYAFRNDAERRQTRAFVKTYLDELRGDGE